MPVGRTFTDHRSVGFCLLLLIEHIVHLSEASNIKMEPAVHCRPLKLLPWFSCSKTPKEFLSGRCGQTPPSLRSSHHHQRRGGCLGMRARVTGRAPSRLSQLEMACPDGQTPCQTTTVSVRASGPQGIGTALRPVTHCQPSWFQKQGKAAKLAQPSDTGQPPPLLVQRSENQVWSVESGKGRCLVIPQSWRKPSCTSVSSGPGLLTPWDFSGRQPWGGHSLRGFPLI